MIKYGNFYDIGIGATIRIGREIQCLPYAGFFFIIHASATKSVYEPELYLNFSLSPDFGKGWVISLVCHTANKGWTLWSSGEKHIENKKKLCFFCGGFASVW